MSEKNAWKKDWLKVVEETARDIKALRIQGASAIRKQAIEALRISVELSRAKNVEQLRKELKQSILMLATARPTEPETRAALRTILEASKKELPIEALKSSIIKACEDYQKDREKAMKKIAILGLKELKKCRTIFTHCHSHTVEDILKLLHKKGKLEHVICTETRPRFQGRITASHLTREGIKCTMIVDGAARTFIKDADAFLTGCDAILADGSIVNKIGTSLISLAAKQASVPHYVASSALSFDPETYYKKEEPIEERAASEVWEKKLKNLEIRNPAFDITEAKLVKAIICEKGIFSPKSFVSFMVRELELKKKPYVPLMDLLKK